MKNKLGQNQAFSNEYDSGMSKRFYAACSAMNGILANPELGENWFPSNVAIHALVCADELLKQE